MAGAGLVPGEMGLFLRKWGFSWGKLSVLGGTHRPCLCPTFAVPLLILPALTTRAALAFHLGLQCHLCAGGRSQGAWQEGGEGARGAEGLVQWYQHR